MSNRTPNRIKNIVIHCSATPGDQEVTAKDIDRWHRQRGMRKIGYHFVIKLDGTVEKGRDLSEAGAHVQGHNSFTIGICLVGGISPKTKKAKDTYTKAQWASLETLVKQLKQTYRNAAVVGHRDFPGVKKDCPCFDAAAWWAGVSAPKPTV